MKKLIALLLTVLCLAVIGSGCYTRALDSSRNVQYYAAGSDTTYGKLLAAPGGMGSKWDFCNDWTILKGNKSADDTTTVKGAYTQVLDDLKDILDGVTLHALEKPADAKDYNSYAENLMDGKSALRANFATLTTNKITDSDMYLNLLIITVPDNTKCYITAAYRKNGDVNERRYVYSAFNQQLVDKLNRWADKYIEGGKSAVQS